MRNLAARRGVLALSLLLALGLVFATAGVAVGDDGSDGIGRVLIAANGDIEVAAGEQAEAVILTNGTARIGGTVDSVVVNNGTVTTEPGATLGSLVVINSTAELASGTTIRGDISQLSSTIRRADGVTVGGSVNDLAGNAAAFGLFLGAAGIVWWIGAAIVMLVVGLLAAGLAARQVRMAGRLISHEPIPVLLAGLATMVLVPLVAVAAFISLVGIPAGLTLLLVVLPAIAFAGYLVAAIWIGEWLLSRRSSPAVPERPYAAAIVGLIVVGVLGIIPLATAIVSVFGVGSVVLAAWRVLRGGAAQAIGQPAVPVTG
jgi:hypothetical protein